MFRYRQLMVLYDVNKETSSGELFCGLKRAKLFGGVMRSLDATAWEIRRTLIRMFGHGKFHHFGGSLSCAEIVACLYFYKMNYGRENYQSPDRDRFIMSKGHCVPTQYVALAMNGIIDPGDLITIKTMGSPLQGHPDFRKTPGIEACTGSLGQGLSVANGMALAARQDNLTFNIYVLVGDGELQEGQLWEAAMTSSHYGLSNVCLIVDRNKFESQGAVDSAMRIGPLRDRFAAFGWRCLQVDGHDAAAICEALDAIGSHDDRPLAIVADTVKGKGVSSIEATHKGHNYCMDEDEFRTAETEVSQRIAEMEFVS